MNTLKLRAKMVERGMNVEALADALGVDRGTMYRKLNDLDKFRIGEVRKTKDALNLTNKEASEIFLD